MQTDAEEKEDYADFGKLLGYGLVRGKARCKGADRDAGQEVPDDRRQLQSLGYVTEHQRRGQAAGKCK